MFYIAQYVGFIYVGKARMGAVTVRSQIYTRDSEFVIAKKVYLPTAYVQMPYIGMLSDMYKYSIFIACSYNL